MRAAVIRRSGATPALDQFADPQPGQGLSVGTLVSAALNPLDVLLVNDQIPFRRLQPPCIAGYEAVVQLGDGTRWYLAGPPAPYGALAELVPLPGFGRLSRSRPESTPASPPPSGWLDWSDGWRSTTAVTFKPVRRC